MEKCGNCEFKRKIRQTTYYKCEKYGEFLLDNPAEKCKKCLEDTKPTKKSNKNKNEFIEVK